MNTEIDTELRRISYYRITGDMRYLERPCRLRHGIGSSDRSHYQYLLRSPFYHRLDQQLCHAEHDRPSIDDRLSDETHAHPLLPQLIAVEKSKLEVSAGTGETSLKKPFLLFMEFSLSKKSKSSKTDSVNSIRFCQSEFYVGAI